MWDGLSGAQVAENIRELKAATESEGSKLAALASMFDSLDAGWIASKKSLAALDYDRAAGPRGPNVGFIDPPKVATLLARLTVSPADLDAAIERLANNEPPS